MRQQQQMMMWYLIRFISLRNEFPRSELHAENSTPKIPKNNISVEMVQSSTHNTGTIEAKCRARVQFARLISCVVWHSLTSTHKKFLYHCFVQLSWVIILRFTFPVGFLQNMASIHFWFVADQDVLPWSIYHLRWTWTKPSTTPRPVSCSCPNSRLSWSIGRQWLWINAWCILIQVMDVECLWIMTKQI